MVSSQLVGGCCGLQRGTEREEPTVISSPWTGQRRSDSPTWGFPGACFVAASHKKPSHHLSHHSPLPAKEDKMENSPFRWTLSIR